MTDPEKPTVELRVAELPAVSDSVAMAVGRARNQYMAGRAEAHRWSGGYATHTPTDTFAEKFGDGATAYWQGVADTKAEEEP
jgi:hypothetical protein